MKRKKSRILSEESFTCWPYAICEIILHAIGFACILFIIFPVQEQEQHYTYGVYELNFRAKEISNDSVGNAWSFSYVHRGKEIESGDRFMESLQVFTFESIKIEVREDDKLDDIGTGSLSVALSDGSSATTQITVTENSGPYQGRTAIWEITCTVKLVDKQ